MTDFDRFPEFSQHIKEYGTAIEEHRLDGTGNEPLRHARLIAECHWPQSYFAGELGFDYYCNYFVAEYANALAMRREGSYWIGLSSSMLLTAIELAIRVAGTLDLPAGIDDGPKPDFTEGDTMVFGLEPDVFKLSVEKVEKQSIFYQQVAGWSPLRSRITNIFFMELMLFVIRHELFHAALGHCSYLEETFGIRELAEKPLRTARSRKELRAAQRAMELHADWAAYGSVIRMMRSGFDLIGNDITTEYGEVFRFGLTTISASLLPIVFGFEEKTSGPFPQQTHPSAAARLLTFASRIKELKAERTLHQNWWNGVDWAFKALAMLGKQHKGFDAFFWLGQPERQKAASEERFELVDRLNQLQVLLLPFAVLPLGDSHQGSLEPFKDA